MTEKIEVRYTLAGDISSAGSGDSYTSEPFYHKYIVYTDTNGVGYAARGGTSLRDSGFSLSTLPMGHISTNVGLYIADTLDSEGNVVKPGFPDYPKTGVPHPNETIVTGNDLSGYWASITDTMQRIEDAKLNYYPERNSNSAVDTALQNAGLPLPQQDDPGEYYSPGSGNILDIPTSPEPTLPPVPTSKPSAPWSERSHAQSTSSHEEVSPLVLDLDGDGIELTSLDGPGAVYWDLDQDGMAEATGWVGPDDGLLALDRNGDGFITDHTELFGTEDIDGFLVLAELDGNSDGVIDAGVYQFAA